MTNESVHLYCMMLYLKQNISYLQNKTLSDNDITSKSVALNTRNLQEGYNNELMHAKSTPRATRMCDVNERVDFDLRTRARNDARPRGLHIFYKNFRKC